MICTWENIYVQSQTYSSRKEFVNYHVILEASVAFWKGFHTRAHPFQAMLSRLPTASQVKYNVRIAISIQGRFWK